MQVRCYIATKKQNETITTTEINSPDNQNISPKMMIISNKTETLAVADVAGETRGAYSFGGPQVIILEKDIMENIRSPAESDENE